jgi:hypothetical protein
VINGLVTFLDWVIGKDITLEVHLTPLVAIIAPLTWAEWCATSWTRPPRASKSHVTAKWENQKSLEARVKLH